MLSRLAMELSIVNEVAWLSILLCYTLYPTPAGSGPAHAIRYADNAATLSLVLTPWSYFNTQS
jgi:hypothetical protein